MPTCSNVTCDKKTVYCMPLREACFVCSVCHCEPREPGRGNLVCDRDSHVATALLLRPEFSIRLANADVWDGKTGMNKLYTFTLQ